MTEARAAETFVEVVAHPDTTVRAAETFVEVVAHPDTTVRAAETFVEVVIGARRGQWSIGSLRVG